MKWILAATLLLSTLAEAQTVARLTLDSAIAIGKQHSRTLKASAAKAEGASARANEANASLFPSVKVDGSYRRLSEVPPWAVGLPGVGAPIVIFPLPSRNSINVSISSRLKICAGFFAGIPIVPIASPRVSSGTTMIAFVPRCRETSPSSPRTKCPPRTAPGI